MSTKFSYEQLDDSAGPMLDIRYGFEHLDARYGGLFEDNDREAPDLQSLITEALVVKGNISKLIEALEQLDASQHRPSRT